MESLFTYFEWKSGLTLTGPEKEQIASRFKPKNLRKKQYLLREGEVCKYFSYILHGAARTYSIDEKGREHILYFGIENWWMGDNESFTQHTPSRLNIDTLEDTQFLEITYDSLQELLQQIPAVALTIQRINNQRIIATEKRVQAAISQTPEERFEAFRNAYPNLMQRFPLSMIASYLGISTKTLGRIRNGS